ncbi:MAG: hypothetical protein GF355_02265, partial [Candidatus Eisenbacteria bacterium]|nr:hypothetical protein [Candidatus Eisenbacteria bacterium]
MKRCLAIAATLQAAMLASPAPAAEWVEIIPDGPKPPPRAYTTAAYDSQRHRMLIFGG